MEMDKENRELTELTEDKETDGSAPDTRDAESVGAAEEAVSAEETGEEVAAETADAFDDAEPEAAEADADNEETAEDEAAAESEDAGEAAVTAGPAAASASPEMKASTAAKREKKKAAREAKAERKKANKIEEKKTRPNNVILAIMIFGVLIGMFAFVKCYNYFSKPADIAAYLEKNGGEETYGNMPIDAYTTAAITAEGNSMKIVMDSKIDSDTEGADDIIDDLTEYFKGDDGTEFVKYIGAYYLTTIKPEVRGFSGDVSVSINVNDKEANSAEMTYKEAKQFLEDLEKESEEGSEDAEAEDEAAAGDADAEDEADAEDAAAEDEAADGAGDAESADKD